MMMEYVSTSGYTIYTKIYVQIYIYICYYYLLGTKLNVAPIPLSIELPSLYLDVQDLNGTYMATGHVNPLIFNGQANATLDAYIRQDLSNASIAALATLTQAYINKQVRE